MASNSKKLSIIDVINEYLSQGQKPPPALLAKAAEQEALQKPPPALDPVALTSGAYAFGPLSEAANEAIGLGAQYGGEGAQALGRLARGKAGSMVPSLIQMAGKGDSAPTGPIRGGVRTQPLLPRGVPMPGGTTQAPPTRSLNTADVVRESLNPAETPESGYNLGMLLGGSVPEAGFTGPEERSAPGGTTSLPSVAEPASRYRTASTATLDEGSAAALMRNLRALASKNKNFGTILEESLAGGEPLDWTGAPAKATFGAARANQWSQSVMKMMKRVLNAGDEPGVHEIPATMLGDVGISRLYNNPEGKPIAMLEQLRDVPKKGSSMITAMGADPQAGIAGKRAVLQLLSRSLKDQPTYADDVISPYTEALLNKLLTLGKDIPK